MESKTPLEMLAEAAKGSVLEGAYAAKLKNAAVHLIDAGAGAPAGCLRSKCGVILGDHNPRLTDEVEQATCAKCIANLKEWQLAQEAA